MRLLMSCLSHRLWPLGVFMAKQLVLPVFLVLSADRPGGSDSVAFVFFFSTHHVVKKSLRDLSPHFHFVSFLSVFPSFSLSPND